MVTKIVDSVISRHDDSSVSPYRLILVNHKSSMISTFQSLDWPYPLKIQENISIIYKWLEL